MSVEFVSEGIPVSLRDLDELERRLGVELPSDYRSFLLRRNGGRVHDNDLATPEGEEIGIAVVSFLSLGSEGGDSMDEFLGVYSGRYPKELLPVAEAVGGNLILIRVEGRMKGEIYFWDHEQEGDEEPVWENLTLLAPSFDQFMEALVPYVD
ncbi:SMI1/KNR4 family protein [Actinomadura sp. K4S16]|uniref:SMI1/KNR4 family protein n=1 Tax=Actinomadura sp. K4S16 TaxID=1316147 RepID=UPI00135945B6|nr:SMI1/KNR4 family protein [Actinomadura sp. K4S16]